MIEIFTLKSVLISDECPYLECGDCCLKYSNDFEVCPLCGGKLKGYCSLDWRMWRLKSR